MAKANEYLFDKFNFKDLVDAPSNPVEGALLLYTKGGKFYFKDSTGVETEIAAGSFVPTTRTINSKALTSDITLTAEDLNIVTPTKSIAFYIDDILEVGTSQISVIIPQDLTISGIIATVDVAPTGSSLMIDINKNGTTLYTTQANRPTIIDGNSSAIATLPDVITLSLGDKISIDIDQVGNTIAGNNLSVVVICEVI